MEGRVRRRELECLLIAVLQELRYHGLDLEHCVSTRKRVAGVCVRKGAGKGKERATPVFGDSATKSVTAPPRTLRAALPQQRLAQSVVNGLRLGRRSGRLGLGCVRRRPRSAGISSGSSSSLARSRSTVACFAKRGGRERAPAPAGSKQAHSFSTHS